MKIDDFQKSILFCKYLRNESSDLYEISDFPRQKTTTFPQTILLYSSPKQKKLCFFPFKLNTLDLGLVSQFQLMMNDPIYQIL